MKDVYNKGEERIMKKLTRIAYITLLIVAAFTLGACGKKPAGNERQRRKG